MPLYITVYLYIPSLGLCAYVHMYIIPTNDVCVYISVWFQLTIVAFLQVVGFASFANKSFIFYFIVASSTFPRPFTKV